MKTLISQIKHSVESLSSKLDQIKDRLSRFDDKINVLEHSDENKKEV
jgi:archaellum component FlaC